MNPNTAFECFTQRIIQRLVRHNVKLKGKSGCEHQIDVYWEYEKYGAMNRVAIECKNYDSNVSIGKVRDFLSVLQDLENVRGIMVTSKGYQKGAKKFGEYYGISLKKLRRPEWNESIGAITTVDQMDSIHRLYKIDEGWAAERNIRDSQGNVISSLDNLELMCLEKQEPGTVILFPFKDGWVDSRHWGPVRIREVKFEYESTVQETTIQLAADDFVEAILEDVLCGKTDYVPRY